MSCSGSPATRRTGSRSTRSVTAATPSGQRNTYARAAAIVAARDTRRGPGPDRRPHRARPRRRHHRPARDPRHRPRRPPTPHHAQPALEWLGRKAFDARYGDIPGIDHDYGMRWGAAGNQRISFRRHSGATEGMLYAYDPTWDEYALIARHVPVRRRVHRVRRGAAPRRAPARSRTSPASSTTASPSTHPDRDLTPRRSCAVEP